ncbi:MAG: outer membrane lipoprotein-sorting protein [Candidatus Marinimicrobia bacterium]|jgi:outer membrane lipoprotein-sorting protein|nr:outer membrane lipoprotein-sorting protein [Candidatus Neomarinimicrobiota bacterium]MBT3692032.1 outer membrane lipoprotein-sorting protein [Candidatus Neomarinimicrobiota bacterium]MBT3732859.1 outer membrane lipoprotein-sorting protein [Candidatus Neomarinimicrobiota bacterium]MBT4144721.1 outer membrane lipoprotein-sorting protein [Candidatus Neomarinimicrobiota bacterium]MBT4178156.1 outer membrane lipoprotein-sorting protein [Candidatus Neomarinimicrobiota bacterium]
MMRTFKLIIIYILCPVVLFGQRTGLEIMEQVKNNPLPSSSITHIELTIVTKKGKREKKKIREFIRYQKNYESGKYERKTLVRFTKPLFVKGTGLLNWTQKNGVQEQWIFLPKLKTAKKITSKDRTKSFMGSDFIYEDLESRSLNEDTFTEFGIEVIFNTPCYVIEAKPKEESAYQWQKIWVETSTWQIKKVEYYNEKNKIIKTLSIPKHKIVNGFYIPEKMTMISIKGNQTSMVINKATMDAGLQNDIFSKKFLIRIK